MKYLVELTEDQMDAVRVALADTSVGKAGNDTMRLREARIVLGRAPLVPDECACALGPIGDDLCPVHDADIDVDDDADYDAAHHRGKAI